MREIHIKTVADMLELSPDEFQRMLPDLALWYAFAKTLHGMPGVQHTGFIWSDDGRTEMTAARLTDPATGDVTEFKL